MAGPWSHGVDSAGRQSELPHAEQLLADLRSRGPTSGQLTRQARELKGWSEAKTVDVLNDLPPRTHTANQPTFSKWENDQLVPGPYWQERLAKVLGIPPARMAAAAARTRRLKKLEDLLDELSQAAEPDPS